MPRRKLTIILASLVILASALTAQAKTPVRFRYGADWGLCPEVFQAYNCTYYTKIGYRISDGGFGVKYYTNGYFTLNAGIEFADHCAMYLKSGYMGLFQDFRVMPLLAEFQYFFKGYEGRDSAFLLLSGGTALHDFNFEDKTAIASLGAGYRHILSRKTSVDVVARLQTSGCHPLPYDEYEGRVPRGSIIYSNAGQVALCLGVSLNF